MLVFERFWLLVGVTWGFVVVFVFTVRFYFILATESAYQVADGGFVKLLLLQVVAEAGIELFRRTWFALLQTTVDSWGSSRVDSLHWEDFKFLLAKYALRH